MLSNPNTPARAAAVLGESLSDLLRLIELEPFQVRLRLLPVLIKRGPTLRIARQAGLATGLKRGTSSRGNYTQPLEVDLEEDCF